MLYIWWRFFITGRPPKTPKGPIMAVFNIVSLSAVIVLLVTITACGERDKPHKLGDGVPRPTDIELGLEMEEELLALADNRAEWFLASDITTEALEGLYDSWSVICRNETSLADYKGAVYKVVRPWFLEMTNMELKDLQEAGRYYDLESWNPPWAYVKETWKLDDKIVWGPELQLFLIESGRWHYHDC